MTHRRLFRIGWCALLAALPSMGGCSLFRDQWRPKTPPPQLRGALRDALTTTKGETKPTVEPASTPAPLDGPLKVTVEEAVLLAIENNLALRVEKISPSIQRTFIEQEEAAFDPVVSAEALAGQERVESSSGNRSDRGSATGTAGVSRQTPTGTALGLEASLDRTWGSGVTEHHAARVGASVTQALLEGRPIAVNLANVRQARVDTLFSEYEFRGFAEALVAEVETTYWRLVLAIRGLQIVVDSLELAEKQLQDTQQRIRVGQLAETELAAAEAEVALRRESLINARSLVDTLKVRLLRLVYPQPGAVPDRSVTPLTEPSIPPVPLENLQDHLAVSMKMRPELNQARLLIERGQLEVVKTRNGLLPRMDLFISVGKTGYADSFLRSTGDVAAGDGYDVFVGLSFEHPVGNREDRARYGRSMLTLEQRRQSLENLEDLVRQDVELAFIEVNRTRQQVDATAATRKAQQETVRAETAKFRVGKSTALLVATAQRDLLAAQVAEVQAVANYLNARVALYQSEGSLLARRGLAAPGAAGMLPTTVPASTPTAAPPSHPQND